VVLLVRPILGACSGLRCVLGRGAAKDLVFDAAPGVVIAKRVGVRPLSEKPAQVLF
jgi:hypothetical protein